MNYRAAWTEEDICAAWQLFNRSVFTGETLYQPFPDRASFERFFFHREEENLTVVNLISEDRAVFACGCYSKGEERGFITLLLVRPDARRQGRGRDALHALEEALARVSGGKIRSFEITFFNPMNFTWQIPGTDGHDHPNAPGVDMAGGAYVFYKNCGYRDFAYQNSYHIDLADYHFPADIQTKIAALEEKGIRVVRYDPNVHTGLPELFDNLGNELWRRDIMGNLARPDGGDPVLIVDKGGRAMGFTGPLSVQESGRGFFCGIGVHTDCRGAGVGKVLFANLCDGLKGMGARFMTLFTGETNPARNIYEAAGFSIVRCWADMRKTL